MPMETVDCCKIDGRAIFVIAMSSARLNAFVCPHCSFFSSFKNTAKDSTAEIPCAISVAHATPVTPIWKFLTRTKSSATLNTDEKIRKYRGILDFPRALNMDEITLYINRNGSPIK